MNEARDQFNPADFWPDAEKMLDRHFRRKRIIKWSIVTAFVSAVLVLVAFWALDIPQSAVVQTGADQRKVETKPVKSSNAEKTVDADDSSLGTSPKNAKQQQGSEMHEQAVNSENIHAKNVEKGLNKQQRFASKSKKSNRAERVEANLKSEANHVLSEQGNPTSKQVNYKAESPTGVVLEKASKAAVVDAPISELPISNNEKQENSQKSALGISGLDVLKPLNLLENPGPEINHSVILENRDEKKKCSPKSWNVEANWGVMRNFVHHRGGNDAYRMRRADEEKTAYTFTQGLGVRKKIGNWSVYGGLEHSTYGENTQYKNLVDGEIPAIEGTVILNYDSTIVNRNIYYLGNEFQESVLVINTDSLITYDTLFSSGSVTGNLPEGYSGSRNRYTYFEIPVSMSYSVWKSRRLSIDGFAGISVGILQQARGQMLNGSNTAFLDLRARETLNKYLLNYRGGLSLHYAFYNGISISLAAEYRGMARSIHTVQSGLNSRYRGAGILVGLSYPISQRP